MYYLTRGRRTSNIVLWEDDKFKSVLYWGPGAIVRLKHQYLNISRGSHNADLLYSSENLDEVIIQATLEIV